MSNNISAMSDKPLKLNAETPSPKLLDQLRERVRLKHFSIRAEQTYVQWVKRYIIFHGTCHPALLEGRYDIRKVQELLGHKDVATTMVYTHVLNKGGHGVLSPLDM